MQSDLHSRQRKIRRDPLYRVSDVNRWIIEAESVFSDELDRLKDINNLGIIPVVDRKMPTYSKYEHAFGTVHQIVNLLRIWSKQLENHEKSLTLASLVLHLGHLPFTYSTEHALLLASSINTQNSKKARAYVKERVVNCLKNSNDYNPIREQQILQELFHQRNCTSLYKFFSGDLLIKKIGKAPFNDLVGDDLKIIISDLIDPTDDGYKYLELADQVDFVQRDALYFGSVRLDIHPDHLYRQLTTRPEQGETKLIKQLEERPLIEAQSRYLKALFYNRPDIVSFDSLYSKIVASIITNTDFNFSWLEDYDDAKFETLLIHGKDIDDQQVLPAVCTIAARKLFQGALKFEPLFQLNHVIFDETSDILDVECELAELKRDDASILSYPFTSGILIVVQHSKNDESYNSGQYSISLYQDQSRKHLLQILRIINRLMQRASIDQMRQIRKALATRISWTGKARMSEDQLVPIIADALSLHYQKSGKKNDDIKLFAKLFELTEPYRERQSDVIKRLSAPPIEDKYYADFWGGYLMARFGVTDGLLNTSLYDDLVRDFISLPTEVLQGPQAKQFLNTMSSKLFQMLESGSRKKDNKGHAFEALCLINKMKTKKGVFQFYLWGAEIVNDNNVTEGEFDIIELLINNSGQPECNIYECSISRNYRAANQEKLQTIKNSLEGVFADADINTYCVIPTAWGKNWLPKEIPLCTDLQAEN